MKPLIVRNGSNTSLWEAPFGFYSLFDLACFLFALQPSKWFDYNQIVSPGEYHQTATRGNTVGCLGGGPIAMEYMPTSDGIDLMLKYNDAVYFIKQSFMGFIITLLLGVALVAGDTIGAVSAGYGDTGMILIYLSVPFWVFWYIVCFNKFNTDDKKRKMFIDFAASWGHEPEVAGNFFDEFVVKERHPVEVMAELNATSKVELHSETVAA